MLYFNLEMINKPSVLLVAGFGLLTLEENQVNRSCSCQLKSPTEMFLLGIKRTLMKSSVPTPPLHLRMVASGAAAGLRLKESLTLEAKSIECEEENPRPVSLNSVCRHSCSHVSERCCHSYPFQQRTTWP